MTTWVGCPCGSGEAPSSDGKCWKCRTTGYYPSYPLQPAVEPRIPLADSMRIERVSNGWIVTWPSNRTEVHQTFEAVVRALKAHWGLSDE